MLKDPTTMSFEVEVKTIFLVNQCEFENLETAEAYRDKMNFYEFFEGYNLTITLLDKLWNERQNLFDLLTSSCILSD